MMAAATGSTRPLAPFDPHLPQRLFRLPAGIAFVPEHRRQAAGLQPASKAARPLAAGSLRSVLGERQADDRPLHVLLGGQPQQLLSKRTLPGEGQVAQRRCDHPQGIGNRQAHPPGSQVDGQDAAQLQPPELCCPDRRTSSWITFSVISTSLV